MPLPRWRLLPPRLRALPEGGLLGPVLTLLTGTVAAQAVVYLARPVLTRLFEPEAFGLFGFYLAAVTVVATAATGKYEDAVPLPEDARQAAGAAVLALALSGAVALGTLLAVPFREALAAGFGRPEVAPYLTLVPLGIWVTAWGRTAELWLTRVGRFGPISGSRAVQGGVTVPAQIGAGVAGLGALGLVGGHLAGRAAGTLALGASLLRVRSGLRPLLREGLRAEVRVAARRFRRFPLFSMPSGTLNVFSMQLPAFLLLAWFDPRAAGLYAVAYATLAVPMQLVGGAVGQVFFARAAVAYREGWLGSLTGSVYARLSALGLFPMAALALAGPEAFAWVFGAEWREAGVYAQWLAPWLFFVLVSAPLSTLFDVLERQASELAFNVGLTLARLGALAAGAAVGDARTAVALFAAVSAAGWLGHTLWMLRWSGASLRQSLRYTARHAGLALAPLAVVGAAQLAGMGDAGTVGALAAGTALAALLLWRFEPDLTAPVGSAP
jgi:O-antigen/teichoic acid export membrane protein